MQQPEQTVATVEQAPSPTATDSVSGMVQMIERLALSPDVDVTKLEKLLEMQERVMDRQAEQAFNDAMNAVQEKVRPIAADASNPQTRSKYASYTALDRALRPIYTSNGFSLSFDTGDGAPENHVRIVCYVSHSAGHTRSYHADMPADGKGAKGGDVMTKTHATGSAMSYGMRYLLKMIFNVAIGEDDDDGNGAGGGDRVSQEQVMGLRELLESTESDEKRFLAYVNVKRLEDIYASKYDDAVAVIRRTAAKRKTGMA